MFGVSLGEVVLIAVVALVVVGPRRLPEILTTLGQWVGRLRRMTTEVRRQTGIDEILRSEGLAGGLSELRAMIQGDVIGMHRYTAADAVRPTDGALDAYGEATAFDRLREYPVEGPDSYGAIPEDLVAISTSADESDTSRFTAPVPDTATGTSSSSAHVGSVKESV